MDNKIQVFNNERFGSVRTLTINGDPWFVGKDVAVALGYVKPENAIATHVDVEDKTSTLIQGSGSNYKSKTVLINESGLYCLVISSKLPAARDFKLWITREVIPSIRKHGAYLTDSTLAQILSDPQQAHLLVMELVHEKLTNQQLTADLAAAAPKARYFDTFVNPWECTNIRITAKELGIPERRFVRYLLDNHYLYRSPSGVLMPYMKYYARGFFIIRDFHKKNSPDIGHYTLFTALGKAYFMDLADRILEETM